MLQVRGGRRGKATHTGDWPSAAFAFKEKQTLLPDTRKFEPLFSLPNPHLLAWLLPPDPPRSLSVGAR